ncbi:hypothetical protein B0H15DRAFT_802917 [Mycena belliarum]|uniref:Uncharacterized protein n=1 Tax=Mycena belliarum TaxID=1033014 RepID=A0AAD6XNB1_9AGAR|nr:hypothetical protein B0H15DRAFT_802917 [Mycena belliae]
MGLKCIFFCPGGAQAHGTVLPPSLPISVPFTKEKAVTATLGHFRNPNFGNFGHRSQAMRIERNSTTESDVRPSGRGPDTAHLGNLAFALMHRQWPGMLQLRALESLIRVEVAQRSFGFGSRIQGTAGARTSPANGTVTIIMFKTRPHPGADVDIQGTFETQRRQSASRLGCKSGLIPPTNGSLVLVAV